MRHGKNTGWYLKITWVTLPILMVIIYIYWLVEYKKNLNEHWTPTVIGKSKGHRFRNVEFWMHFFKFETCDNY